MLNPFKESGPTSTYSMSMFYINQQNQFIIAFTRGVRANVIGGFCVSIPEDRYNITATRGKDRPSRLVDVP